MQLKKPANFLESRLSPLTRVVGNIGASVIVLMMLLTVSDVVGRRFFNKPVSGAYELSELMLVIVVFFTLAHCEFLRSNITIQLVVSRLRQRAQDVIDSIMYIFFLVTFGLLTWRLWLYAMEVRQNNLVSGVLEVPVYPFVFLESLCCALLSLVILTHLLLFLAGAAKR